MYSNYKKSAIYDTEHKQCMLLNICLLTEYTTKFSLNLVIPRKKLYLNIDSIKH